jgi:protein gp37
MGEQTAISWCDHTFNAWWGCTKVSPGCDHCYAETWAKRFAVEWGHGQARRFFGAKHWREPLRWNARTVRDGIRRRVFCASMADVFDNEVGQEHREQLWALIRATPALDWLVLTKRIGNVPAMLPADWGGVGYANVWLGATIVNQAEADRDVPKLLAVPARVRFLSCEPLLGRIELPSSNPPRVHWVIVGGESGPRARPMHPDWARSLRDQCVAAGTRPARRST